MNRGRSFLSRSEMRIVVALPVVFLLVALTLTVLGIELTTRTVSARPLTASQTRALVTLRLWLVGLGSLGALGLGALLAVAIARPLRATIERARVSVGAVAADPLAAAPANEIARVTHVLGEVLRVFDRTAAHAGILDAMPDGVALLDARGRIRWANHAARRLLPVADGGLEGRALDALADGPLGDELGRVLERARQSGAAVHASPLRAGRGSAPDLSVVVTPSVTRAGEFLMIVRDTLPAVNP